MNHVASEPRRLILCADDFAISPGVSEAIVSLLKLNRLSATSCMSASTHWKQHGGWLKEVDSKVDFGLHITLTTLSPIGDMPLTAPEGKFPTAENLIRKAYGNLLCLKEIESEIELQIDAFSEILGRPPDFLDGHHHVHMLPGIREIVTKLFLKKLDISQSYIRNCCSPLKVVFSRKISPLKSARISLFAMPLKRLIKNFGIATNSDFSGVYDLNNSVPYPDLFRQFVKLKGDHPMIMCHPGRVDSELKELDSMTSQREAELDYFLSDKFSNDLAEYNFQLGPFHYASN